MVSVNRNQLKFLVEKGSKKAIALSKALEHPEKFLSATLLGTNLATITLNVVATLFVIRNFGERYEFLTILVTAPLGIIFAEVIPKAIYQRFADRIAPHVVFPLRILSWILSPLVWIAIAASRLGMRLFSVPSTTTTLTTREELSLMYRASKRESGVKDLERRMIHRIFEFSDQKAYDIMIPLIRVVSVREDSSIRSAIRVMKQSGYSRIPVYDSRVFNIVGWVNHYDLLSEKDHSKRVHEIMRDVHYIPENIELDTLLVQMQKNATSLAVVVDEYGGAVGIVTLEDILEEVVGEIRDEYDRDVPAFERLDAHRLRVSARISIEKLNELLPRKIPEGDYETLGGYLVTRLKRIPSQGHEITYGKLLFKIIKADARAVSEVEIVHP